jgi:hypothetical protein
MPRPPDLAFVACIEAGILERQALLLFESIRAFGGALAECPIYALAPRAGLGVRGAALDRLEALHVEYIDEVLNTECFEYGSANRVLAAAHVERTTAHEILVVLDSDTLVMREPAAFLLPPDVDVALRPVDLKDMCTSGPGDPHDAYWRDLCRTCGVSYDDIPWALSYVDEARAKASYNGGLVVARTERRILRRWADFFLASVRAGLRPRAAAVAVRSSTGAVEAQASRMWGSNQAALSLAVWSTTRRVLTLDPTYNYPLHLHEALGDRRARDLDRLVHVHYHWLFDKDASAHNPLTAPESTLAAEKTDWLRARTPLRSPRAGRALKSGRRALLVLGMHRSGTSALTRTLNLAGAQLPSRLLEAGVNNATGYWESADLTAIHDRVLESAGTTWRDFAPFPDAWHASEAAEAFREEILALLDRDFGTSPLFVIKDPRVCRLVPLWTSVLERFGAEASFLIAFRNPIEVAESLKVRDGFHPARSLLMWLRHVIDAERGSRGSRRALVSYETLLGDWRAVVRRVGRELGLEWPGLSHTADAAVEAFLDRGLRHQQSTIDDVRRRPEVLAWARSLYEALVATEEGSSAGLIEVVDAVGAQLDLAERAFGPVIAEYESQESDRAAYLESLEREAASLRAHGARLQAELDAIRGGASFRMAEPLRKALAWWRARRDAPLVARSGLFDAPWYLDRNRDVAASGVDPLLHYLVRGWIEGRDPGPRFDTLAYLRAHPGLAGSGLNPLTHFLLHAGRRPGEEAERPLPDRWLGIEGRRP